MHVVAQIRYYKRNSRQSAVVCREAGEGQVACGRHVCEIGPGVVGADVAERKIAAAAGIRRRWHAFGIAGEAQSGAAQLRTEVGNTGEAMRAVIAADALGRRREQCQIVRLAWMS